jgi:serine/threonine-protein kinase
MKFSPATWSTLSRLLDEALDLDPAQRTDWLERISDTQPELAPALRRLLAAHATSETADVLAHPPALAAAFAGRAAETGLASGDRVGPYRLVRELGSGGMADVWLAERADGAFVRTVALKLPRINRLRRDLAARFARERDILARLEHPNIARLYDAGLAADGLPYLAMEYVDGRPITRYCDERRLPVAQRVRLFVQVLDAVQYAHANLVIHRDLKPSNILVTADAQVRLLDFGIAKLLADDDTARETQLTQLAGRALTPDYASPEQVRGEPLSIASDVYSLGVVLYELLAGQRPYKLKVDSAAQLELAILEAEPARPSAAVDAAAAASRGATAPKLARALAGDLDAIVLKALAKAPAARYATIAALAADLQDHLDGRPVRAQRASAWYRARRFVQRNLLAVGAVAAMLVAVLAGTVVALSQARLAQRQAARAEQVKDFVLTMFEDANPDAGAGRKTSAVDLLRQAQQRLAATPVDDVAIRVELATAVGNGLLGLGETEPAERMLAEAHRVAVDTFGAAHFLALMAQLAHGEALLMQGRTDGAAQQIEAAEAGLSGGPDARARVTALRWKATVRLEQGRTDEGLALARQAVDLAERTLGPRDARARMETYAILVLAMGWAGERGRLEVARKGYELAREIYADRVTNPLLNVRALYAFALVDEGDAALGLKEMRELIAQQTALLGADHRDVGFNWARLGLALLTRGQVVEAIAPMQEALRVTRVLSGGAASDDVAYARLRLGLALAGARRDDAAMAELQAALDFYRREQAGHPYAARARLGIARLLTRAQRIDEAGTILRELQDRREVPAQDLPLLQLALAQWHLRQGRHEEAATLLAEARAKPPSAFVQRHAEALATLGLAEMLRGRADAAIPTLREAVDLFRTVHPEGSPDAADAAAEYGRALLAGGQPREALVELQAATRFWQRFDAAAPEHGRALAWLAHAAAAAERGAEASRAAAQAQAILRGSSARDDRALAELLERSKLAR